MSCKALETGTPSSIDGDRAFGVVEPSTELARNTTVAQLVAACQAAETVILSSFAALVEAERLVNAVFSTTDSWNRGITIDASDNYSSRFDDPARAIERMERQCWRHIVERLELRRLLSIQRWKELDRELDKGKLPRITIENVSEFARAYGENIEGMHEEAVREIFEWLRPPGTRYKTNSEFEIGPRVILSHVVQRRWSGKGYAIYSEHYAQRLLALENVFNALAGNGMIAKSYRAQVHAAIEATDDGHGETELFTWKVFKNGNLHLEFKRLDLLAALNRKAGGMRLRR